MRILLAICLALCAAPAIAEESPRPAVAQSQDLAPTVAALDDFFQAIFFDIGLFDSIVAAQAPQWRQQLTSSPQYQTANAEQRAALDAFVETIPSLFREEVDHEITIMATNMAPRTAAAMQPSDVRVIANLFRMPEMQPLMRRFIGVGIANDFQGAPPDPTPEEIAFLNQFVETPDGRIVVQHGETLFAFMRGELAAANPRIAPRLQARLALGLCEAMGQDCADGAAPT